MALNASTIGSKRFLFGCKSFLACVSFSGTALSLTSTKGFVVLKNSINGKDSKIPPPTTYTSKVVTPITNWSRFHSSKIEEFSMEPSSSSGTSSTDGGGTDAGTFGVTCEPCASLDTSSLLPLEAVRSELSTSSLSARWKLKPIASSSSYSSLSEEEDEGGKGIEKTYALSRWFTAKNFQCALDAIVSAGAVAEREGHHPDFHLTNYRDVEIVIFTHKVGGITRNDLTLAKLLDEEVEVVYSPKWLKQNPNIIQP